MIRTKIISRKGDCGCEYAERSREHSECLASEMTAQQDFLGAAERDWHKVTEC